MTSDSTEEKRDPPVAAIAPFDGAAAELWGAMRGTVTVAPGTDLTRATGEEWDAEI
jgi:hypothetical protein